MGVKACAFPLCRKFKKKRKFSAELGTSGHGKNQVHHAAFDSRESKPPYLRLGSGQQPHSGVRRKRQIPRPVSEYRAALPHSRQRRWLFVGVLRPARQISKI